MRFWFFSAGPNRVRRHPRPAPSVRPFLESLEDRCLPSANFMPVSAAASTPPAAMNTIASLSHDQIHMLQDQSQQQTALATIRLEVEQVVLGILQQFAPQTPQFQPVIASLTSDIPARQATVQMLQHQTDLLNQLDDLQDQSLILNAVIQNAAPVVSVLQQLGNEQAANALQNTIVADQAAVQALQPQIAAVEVEVSAFV
ncbi:MAG TPA: hypothetical protein VN688_15650 [Gemmataceae bacterium]|nr:hypothetical protein [Gemmataceae bacterium]